MLDAQAGSGTVDVTVDTTSIDLGHDKLNDHVKGARPCSTWQKYPTATYTGKLTKFVDGKPTEVDGTLTLHGVTKPLTLKIDQFRLQAAPDAEGQGSLRRERHRQRSIAKTSASTRASNYGFKMDIGLAIQVEAIKEGRSSRAEARPTAGQRSPARQL